VASVWTVHGMDGAQHFLTYHLVNFHLFVVLWMSSSLSSAPCNLAKKREDDFRASRQHEKFEADSIQSCSCQATSSRCACHPPKLAPELCGVQDYVGWGGMIGHRLKPNALEGGRFVQKS
jgi:hypothetical protein